MGKQSFFEAIAVETTHGSIPSICTEKLFRAELPADFVMPTSEGHISFRFDVNCDKCNHKTTHYVRLEFYQK